MESDMVRLVLVGLALALTTPAAAADAPVDVMVLGSYHFGNPGMDINNMKADSVLTPQRQQQLQQVAAALATFKPTHVMVETESDAPDLAVAEYTRFDAAMLAKVPNEIVQIGYRTASLVGLKTVNGIDEQPKAGEPDYFPFDKLQEAAAKFGQTAALEATNVPVAVSMKAFEAAQKSSSVGRLLVRMNTPGTAMSGMDSYYGVLGIGDHDQQTGADFNAAWYLRNAKIFGKLVSLVKPGDRVLVVYGGGHGFWLRHFAGLTPGFRNVDVLPYLQKAQ
jgi:hypothetical protein